MEQLIEKLTFIIQKANVLDWQESQNKDPINQRNENNNSLDSNIEQLAELKTQTVVESEKQIEKTEKLLPELQKLEFGTIIWALRYESEEEKDGIDESHRAGPYIVLGCDESLEYLICLKGGGTPITIDDRHPNYQAFYLNKEDYQLIKQTHFSTMRLAKIDNQRFMKVLDMLTTEDKNNLAKKVNILKRKKSFVSIPNKIPDLPLEAGDIISKDLKLQLVLESNKTVLTCVPLIERHFKNFPIKIGHKEYDLDFPNTAIIENVPFLHREDFITKTLFLSVLKKQKEYYKNIQERKIINRGSVVSNGEDYYYVYGENGDKWQLFQIYCFDNELDGEIQINNYTFYTQFDKTIEIPKNDDQYFIISKASEEQMDLIKASKKDYKKKIQQQRVKNAKKPIVYHDFKEGCLVQERNLAHTKYVVIKRNHEDIICLELEGLKDDEYNLELKRFSSVFKIGNMPKEEYLEVINRLKTIDLKVKEKKL